MDKVSTQGNTADARARRPKKWDLAIPEGECDNQGNFVMHLLFLHINDDCVGLHFFLGIYEYLGHSFAVVYILLV